jgi:type I restriction enzyme S subunit
MEIIRSAAECSRFRPGCFFSAALRIIHYSFVEMFGDETNPKNWPMVNVEEIADVSVGVVIKPASYYTDPEHGVKAFRSLNIGEMVIKDNEWAYFSKEGNEKNSKSILSENDLLIVRSGAPGTACVVTKEYSGCNAIDIIIARPNTEKINPYYLCMYTNMPHGKRQIDEGTGGAAQQHFNVGKYNKLKLMLPSKEKQDQFADFVFQINKSKSLVQQALAKDQLLFDSLMQQYFG